ncbi:MAG TPA: GGDEF domain-containing protein [Gaiellaceae bacterium]|jgi:diguanylate cyclase (GGDEF)-like protein|nr:GGDEF domain-containing protein [Gaiellaceae bacterium]
MSLMLRPISERGRGRRLAPFAVGVLGGLAFISTESAGSGRLLAARLGAVAVVGILAAAVAFVPWSRLPARLETVPGFGVLAVVGLVVAGSGAQSAYAPLVMLPLLWFAVYAERVALTAAIVLADVFLLANVLGSSGAVEAGAVRAAVLWSVIVTVAPWALHRFVHDLQHRAALADRDYVTELLSRRAWEERLPEELARARRDGKPLSIALLDLDRFKQYNDAHGHQAGDTLLRQVAMAWGERLRSTDLLARFGGDEFCAALPGCAAEDARGRATRLLAATPAGIEASVGIAEWADGESVEALVRRADRALYEAKARAERSVVLA